MAMAHVNFTIYVHLTIETLYRRNVTCGPCMSATTILYTGSLFNNNSLYTWCICRTNNCSVFISSRLLGHRHRYTSVL